MIRKKIILGLTTLVLCLGLTFGLSPAAGADPIPNSCNPITTMRVGIETYQGWTYSYSKKYTTPSWSGCSDINITWVQNLSTPLSANTPYHEESCAWFRTRFYPSSWNGGSYTNDWKVICNDLNSNETDPTATSVKNNTSYRIETRTDINFGYTIFD